MKYRVRGTIELNWENVVEAESAEEAERQGKDWAEDGVGLDIPTGDTKVWSVVAIESNLVRPAASRRRRARVTRPARTATRRLG